MAASTCTLPAFSLSDSLSFVKQELRRIPRGVRIGLRKLGLFDDLLQELHLAYLQAKPKAAQSTDISRALHAAGERFRYHQLVRRAQREVPEDFAGRAYRALVYGESVDDIDKSE